MAKDNRRYADRAEYIRKAVKKRRHKLMLKACEYKGNKCAICEYDRCTRALSFHHIDPKTKKFGLTVKGLCYSWKTIQEELDKCILLCSNCHMEVHAGITQLPNES